MLKRPLHTIEGHEVHVWHLIADEVTDEATLLAIHALLSDDERDRMDRFRYERDRTLYLLSRGLMRSVLASYLGCQACDVRFSVSNFGKPTLHAETPEASGLCFNLTHSQGAAALAVGNGREVGIDLEGRERQVEYLALAERYFAEAEARHLLALPDEQRGDAFFAIWTLKEAFVKAIGRGITFPLDAFCFDLDVNQLLRFRPLEDFVSPDWHFHQFEIGERHCGAVAVQKCGPEVQITMRDWRSVFVEG